MKSFEEFINEGVAKRVSPDKQRTKNLILESERKYNVLKDMIENMGIDDIKANDYIEYCYNIIMFSLRAKMLERGYTSSGQGAHEAEIAFALTIGFTESEILLLDKLRYFRNGILYYGKRLDKEYAEKVIEFTKRMYTKLKL